MTEAQLIMELGIDPAESRRRYQGSRITTVASGSTGEQQVNLATGAVYLDGIFVVNGNITAALDLTINAEQVLTTVPTSGLGPGTNNAHTWVPVGRVITSNSRLQYNINDVGGAPTAMVVVFVYQVDKTVLARL